ncbi:MAG: hypothetical protein Q7K26_06150 [bacterium]|nr:hypothetical protein [bacterium]
MDKTTAPDVPLYEYLSDSNRGLNKTQVFIKLWKTSEISTVHSALKYLVDRQANDPNSDPLVLHLTSERNRTVILEANQDPKIQFGKSVPNTDQGKDVSEILLVLSANGINATYKT